MTTRRAFLTSSMAGLVTRTLHGGPSEARREVVIYEGTYPGWPWITLGADGTLHCVFREGTVHDYSASGKALICHSRDRGRTWSKPQVIVDAPDVDDRNVAIVELPGRDLLVSYNSYTRKRESLALVVRSADGGKTWGSPTSVGVENTRTRSAPLVLRDGSLLLPYYRAPGSGALAAHSKDGGRTWKTVAIPDTKGFVGDEWDALEVAPGQVLGVLRNNLRGSDGSFWLTRSNDSGRTWSVPRRTNVQSRRHPSPAQLVFQGMTPTLIYSDRRMVSVSAVRTHDRDYLAWDLDHRHPCYTYQPDESPILDGSYPVSVVVGPRDRLIVDYEIRKDSKRIVGHFVTFPADW